MDAVAELSAEQGYEATKIADIVRRAGVARKTLYDNFEGKEEVFLAAFDRAADEVFEGVELACANAGEDWRARVQAGLAAFLTRVSEDPIAARMCMIEALSATPVAADRYESAMQRFVVLLRGAVPKGNELPDTIEETIVGGLAWIVYQQLRKGEGKNALDLLDELAEFLLAPFEDADSA